MILTLHLVIRGRVQGVFYRESMRREALQKGITGWVRNRPDGCVEATVQGEAAAVEQLVAWCRRGPPAASVDAVEVGPAEGEFGDFERRSTG